MGSASCRSAWPRRTCLCELAAGIVKDSKPALQGDGAAAVLLAEAAAQASARLVQINLAGSPEDPRLAEVAELTRRAGEARAAIRT
jgi:formiminotetrahydrofolate cyclodeaminase